MVDPTDAVERVLDEPIDDIVSDHLRACYEVAHGRYIEAYAHQVSLGEEDSNRVTRIVLHVQTSLPTVQTFCKLLSSQKDTNWPLPMMYAICLDLRKIAGKADSQSTAKGGRPGSTLEKAAEHMMSCFRTCALDSKSSEDVTKRWGESQSRFKPVRGMSLDRPCLLPQVCLPSSTNCSRYTSK